MFSLWIKKVIYLYFIELSGNKIYGNYWFGFNLYFGGVIIWSLFLGYYIFFMRVKKIKIVWLDDY